MSGTKFSTLCVIVPVFNEADTVREAIGRLRRVPAPAELSRRIIAVDDGSTDGSGEALRELAEGSDDLTVLSHGRNLGKGAAVRTGLERAECDIVLIHDGDLEYDPRDHGSVLAPILEGRADAVIGSRFRGGTAHRVLYFWHSIANRGLTLLSNALTDLNLSDIECCTKAFTREVARGLDIRERGFGVEPEIVAKLARMRLGSEEGQGGRRLRVYEAPVSYAGRTFAEGKKIRWSDGLWAAWCIVRYGVGPVGERKTDPV